MGKTFNEILESATRELSRKKARTATTISAYIISISILLILISFLVIYRDHNRDILGNVGTHFVVYKPLQADVDPCCLPGASSDEGFFASGVLSQPFSQDFVKDIASLSEVMDASPYISYRMNDRIDNHLFIIGGFDPAMPVSVNATTCAPADLMAGRFLTEEDKDQYVLIAEQNYAIVRNYKIGDRIQVLDKEFLLVGIVNPATRPARADVYTHIDIAKELIVNRIPDGFLDGAAINAVLVETVDALSQDKAIEKIKGIDSNFAVYGFACYRPAAEAISASERSIWLLTVIILAGTILFSVKTQMASVIERKQDIGILKAIGWPNRVIAWQILFESLIQSLTGGVLGAIAAIFIVRIVPFNKLAGQPALQVPDIPALLFLLAIILSALGGIIAGIIPALNAAKQYPAESLRRL